VSSGTAFQNLKPGFHAGFYFAFFEKPRNEARNQ
jgi:hypothetical protein